MAIQSLVVGVGSEASKKFSVIPKHIIHLNSGGLDSVVMLYWLKSEGCNIHCLLLNYEQRHLNELEFARIHCQRIGVNYTELKVPQLRGSTLTDGTGSVVVPNRNAVFLSLAVNLAVSAGAESVTFAANADDEAVFPDCRMAFVQTFNNMLRTAEIQVEVCAPFFDKSKAWIAALGRDLGVNLLETWSCYEGGIKPCGKCAACLKRNAALATFNVNPSGIAPLSWHLCK